MNYILKTSEWKIPLMKVIALVITLLQKMIIFWAFLDIEMRLKSQIFTNFKKS